MLIGGPNQSHKVNFKELLPMRERCPRHGLSFAPSILFLRNLSKKYEESTVAFVETSFARPAWLAQGAERSEKGKMLTPERDSSPFLQKLCPSGFPLAANGLGPVPAVQNGADPAAAARGFFVSDISIQGPRPPPLTPPAGARCASPATDASEKSPWICWRCPSSAGSASRAARQGRSR